MEGLPSKDKEEASELPEITQALSLIEKAPLEPKGSPVLDDKELEEEEWREIESHGGYSISTKGRVKGRKFQVLAQRTYDGYKLISLTEWQEQKRKVFRVHRLVAEAFLPNPLGLPEVNHIDRNRANNRVENLEWCTRAENVERRGPSKAPVPYEWDDLPGEVWRTIPGDFRIPYMVSNFGRVLMKHGKKSRGRPGPAYRSVGLTRSDGRVSTLLVHVLVATAFLGRPAGRNMVVNHKDLNKHNNCLSNLEWISSRENSMHAFDNGARRQHAVIQFTKDGKYVAEFKSASEAGRQMNGVKQHILLSIKTGCTAYGFLWKKK